MKSFILWLAPLVVALGVLRCYTPNDPPPCHPGSVDWPRCDPTQPPWPMAVERHMAPRDAGVDR